MSVRKRFIDSIEYLRKMGFFEEYSNLTSEEIFERISEGSILFKDVEKDEKWVEKSVFEIDRSLVINDKRIYWFRLEWDEPPESGVGLEFLNGLASISRGVFQPTDVKEELKLEKDEVHPLWAGLWSGCCRVYFTYKKKRESVELLWSGKHGWNLGNALNHINWLIQGTGSYYQIDHPDLKLFVFLRLGEAKKLRVERGWILRGVW